MYYFAWKWSLVGDDNLTFPTVSIVFQT